jgi:poly(3-hydroxybutyrate) depolymerase
MSIPLPVDAARSALYRRGYSAVLAEASDPRFAYALYVPTPRAGTPGLLVTVHHTLRNFIECRDGFAAFAERHHLVVLAPLFPVGVQGDGDPDGYKYLCEGELRYDLLLHRMIDGLVRETGCEGGRFWLQGYSGGGHFAHRYLLLHPERLHAVSIGAPGQVTLADDSVDWWGGVRDLEAVFGRRFDRAALQRVPVQLVVGSDDTRTDEMGHAPGTRYWRADAAFAGANRIERLRTLEASLRDAGVEVSFETMPGVQHNAGALPSFAAAQRFFRQQATELPRTWE